MASTERPKRKPKPLPLARSLYLINEERVNVARRTRERKAQLSIDSEEDTDYSVDKATQTDIPLREVLVEIHDWHSYLSECILFLSCLVMHEPSIFPVALHDHKINKSIIFIFIGFSLVV